MVILWLSQNGYCSIAKEITEQLGKKTLIKDSKLKDVGKKVANLLMCQNPKHAAKYLKEVILNYDADHPGGEITHVVCEGEFMFLNALIEDMNEEPARVMDVETFVTEHLQKEVA